MDEQILSWNYDRRFGLEIEVNAADSRDFVLFPLAKGELPLGIDYIGDAIKEITKKPVIVEKWHYTHNNQAWVLKPDRSCGIEICTPVSKGWYGIREIENVVNKLAEICIGDHRCSVHVHVEVADCTPRDIASILAWWIKCEPVFIDSVPASRKRNRFCQSLGTTDLFDLDEGVGNLFNDLAVHKYFTINTYHMSQHKRKTIEFRIMEASFDCYSITKWIQLLIHFVDTAKNKKCPSRYREGNPMTGLVWLDLIDVMKILGFMNNNLSKTMEDLRNWFLYRIMDNINTDFKGLWSNEFRKVTKIQ
jgi:hypothetical protein